MFVNNTWHPHTHTLDSTDIVTKYIFITIWINILLWIDINQHQQPINKNLTNLIIPINNI